MKKLLNRRIALVLVAVIATVAFFSFKSGDDRNFQIAKNLDTFNAIVKELDMFYWIPLIRTRPFAKESTICFSRWILIQNITRRKIKANWNRW